MKNLTILFTDYNTVIFSTGETMSQQVFFRKLEDNIEDDSYDVNYEAKDKAFLVRYNDNEYHVILTNKDQNLLDNDILSDVARKLLSLSKIQNLVDFQNGNKTNLTTIMDYDAKQMYLAKLQRENKFAFKKYFQDLVKDYHISLKKTKKLIYKFPFFNLEEMEVGSKITIMFLSLLAAGIALAILVFLGGVFLGGGEFIGIYPTILLNTVLSPQLFWFIFPLTYIGNLLASRIKRLFAYIKKHNSANEIINNLKRSIENEKKLFEEQEKKTYLLEEKIEKSKEYNFDVTIVLKECLDNLHRVNISERSAIRKRIREVLETYKKIISQDNSLHDNEIYYNNPKLTEMIMCLKQDMEELIKKNSGIARMDEVESIESLLNEMDMQESQNGFQKKLNGPMSFHKKNNF